jgi:hypothetical protein
VSGPDSGSFGAVDAGSVPSVAAFEGADPPLAAGSPFHRSPERSAVFNGLSGLAGSALAGYHDCAHSELVQGVVDTLLPVAAIGGDRARAAAGAADDSFNSGGQSWRVCWVARLNSVIEHDAVVRNSQDLWIGLSCSLLITCLVVGAFDEFAVLETGAGADEGDQVRGVDRAPALLG